MNPTPLCPQCRQPLPPDAPEGLCPLCVMNGLAETGTLPSEADTVPMPNAAGQKIAAPFAVPVLEELAALFPQLEILELLGRGGMGAVFKARQKNLDRFVALKILTIDPAEEGAFGDRFQREAKALAKLNHPNIVTVHDFGVADGLYYFVMEFVDGANLRAMMQSGEMKPEAALALIPSFCDALQYAHDEGVVHRDIKPENVLVDKKGRVKIADFGLAKLLGQENADHALTRTGMYLGTPRYMAPEQIDRPESVDHRADIYSLGVVFYEMLTGEVPMGRFALPSEKVQVDVKLDEIVLRSLERDVERRYQHASEIKTDVENVSRQTPPPLAEASPSEQSAMVPSETVTKETVSLIKGALWVMGVTALTGIVLSFGRFLLGLKLLFSQPLQTEAYLNDFLFAGSMLGASIAGFAMTFAAWRQGRAGLAWQAALVQFAVAALLPVLSPVLTAGVAVFFGGLALGSFGIFRFHSGVPGALDQMTRARQQSAMPDAKPRTRHLLTAALALLCLFSGLFGLSFQAKMGTVPEGLTKLVTVGALDPIFVKESGPSGFQTRFNFLSWSFFAVVVAMCSFGALWRIGREDQGKVARDPEWWRDWWKQVGIWGGLLLIGCIVRTVKDPEDVFKYTTPKPAPASSPATEGNVTYLEGHTSTVKAVSVSPDGRTLVTAGTDGRALVRDLPGGKLRRTAVASSHPKSEPLARMRTAVMSPDSQSVVISGIDSTTGKGVAFIDLKIGGRLEPTYSAFPIEQIAVTNDPLTVVVALWDGKVAIAKCHPVAGDATRAEVPNATPPIGMITKGIGTNFTKRPLFREAESPHFPAATTRS